MENTDLCFENSSVKADLQGSILSVKNPAKGYIKADGIEKLIIDDSPYKKKAKVYINGERIR